MTTTCPPRPVLEAAGNEHALTAARADADTLDALDDYRHALIEAMAARDEGTDPAEVMRAFYRAAYIAGHLDGQHTGRTQGYRDQLETAVLDSLAELAGGRR